MPFFTFPMIFVAISSFYVFQFGGSIGWIAAGFLLAMGLVMDTVITMFFPPYLIIAGTVVSFMILALVFLVPWPFLFWAFVGKGEISGVVRAHKDGAKYVVKKGYNTITGNTPTPSTP
jgi:hypothetical protein